MVAVLVIASKCNHVTVSHQGAVFSPQAAREKNGSQAANLTRTAKHVAELETKLEHALKIARREHEHNSQTTLHGSAAAVGLQVDGRSGQVRVAQTPPPPPSGVRGRITPNRRTPGMVRGRLTPQAPPGRVMSASGGAATYSRGVVAGHGRLRDPRLAQQPAPPPPTMQLSPGRQPPPPT